MRTLVIVNPTSAGGRTGRRWKDLERRFRAHLGDLDVHMTRGAGEGTTVARKALLDGYERIVCVGGDGTNHEVVNGFYDPIRRLPLNPDAIFAFVPRGTGRDLGRTFDMGTEVEPQLARIATSPIRRMDLIGCSFEGDGGPKWEIAINAASCGQGGDLVNRVNRWKWTGGSGLPFVLAGIEGAVFVRPWRVELTVDDGEPELHELRNVFVCNGRFQGGGMEIAPHARADDGQLELVVMGAVGAVRSVEIGISAYWAKMQDHESVWQRPCRKVTVRPVDGDKPMLVELDGEQPGRVPATYEILPHALRIAV